MVLRNISMPSTLPVTRSHSPAFSVLRMKPRRWAHQKYCGCAPSSLAISSAILFSNPSPFALLKGKLLGSAHTLRSRAAAVAARQKRDNTAQQQAYGRRKT